MLTLGAASVAAFVAAVVVLGDDARAGCVASAREDPSLDVEMSGTIELGTSEHEFEITRAGRPVMDADVCMRIAMDGMNAMGMSTDAEEVAPGVYRMPLTFEMPGTWDATIQVATAGEGTASIPVQLEVQSG